MLAKTIICRAYAEVVTSRSAIEDDELQDGLRYLNRMMAKFSAQGIDVGYTKLSSVDEHLNVSMGITLGMVKNLAVSLFPQYSAPGAIINPLLTFSANKSLETLRAQAFDQVQPAQFPHTLPIGSGNYDSRYTDDFYTNTQGEGVYIASENNDK